MQRLAVLGHDRGERHPLSLRLGDPLDRPRDLALDHPRAAHPHGGRVHLVPDREGALHRPDLLGALRLAHLRHGQHQLHRLVVVQQRRRDAQQLGELQLRLTAVGRQEVDAAPLRDRLAQPPRELRHREGRRDARTGTQLAQRGLRSRPHDILDREVVAVERLLARVGVDHARDRGHVQTEKVAERGVLPEIVGVIGVVVGRERIARKQHEAAADLAPQRRTPRRIGGC